MSLLAKLSRHGENMVPVLTLVCNFFYKCPVAMVMEFNDCLLSEGVLSEEWGIRRSSFGTHLENLVN